MTILSASQLNLLYGEVEIFSDLNLDVYEQARIGIVGSNGSGKTSLLRILTGEMTPNSGSVSRNRNLRIGYVSQIPESTSKGPLKDEIMKAFDDLIVLEDQMAAAAIEIQQNEGAMRSDAERRYSSLLDKYEIHGGYDYQNLMERVVVGVGLDLDNLSTPISLTSGGQRTRAALAKALLMDPDLLILDEPTNYLDFSGLEWLERFLVNFDYSVMVVSHDRYFLDRVANEIWELENGRLQKFTGNFTKYRQLKHEQTVRQKIESKRQEDFIAKEEYFIQRYMAGQRTKEAQGRLTRLNKLERVHAPEREKSITISKINASRVGQVMLNIQDLKVGFTNSGTSVELLSIPDTQLNRGSRTAIVGRNGKGKTSLLKTILAIQPPLSGSVTLGHNVQVGYLEQGTDNLPKNKSVLDAFLDAKNIAIGEARNYLARFLFQGDDVFGNTDSLSGGERTRLALARLLINHPNVLVLDEPTTHLDIPSREALETALAHYDGALLFVSHDRHFISIMADQIWAIEDGSIDLFHGTFSEWNGSRASQAKGVTSKRARIKHRKQQRETRKLKKKKPDSRVTINHEVIIEKLESDLAEIESKLATASQDQDLTEITRLGVDHRRAQDAVERAWETWDE